jgi:hypothetical protein
MMDITKAVVACDRLELALEAINRVIDILPGEQFAPLREQLEAARRPMVQDHLDLQRAIATLKKYFSEEPPAEVPKAQELGELRTDTDEPPGDTKDDDESDDEQESASRPLSLPTNFDIISTILADHPDGLVAKDLLAEMRKRYWDGFPASTTAGFYDFITRGKLMKDGSSRIRLPAVQVQGVDRNRVLAAKREEVRERKPGVSLPEPMRRFEHGGKEIKLGVLEWRLVSRLYSKIGTGMIFPENILSKAIWTDFDQKVPTDVRSYLHALKASGNTKIAEMGLTIESTHAGYFIKEA